MDATQTVEALLVKATNALDPVQAMNFAQAACNAANALRALAEIGVHVGGADARLS